MTDEVPQAANRMSVDGTRTVVDGIAGLALMGLLGVTLWKRNQALRRVAEATLQEESAKRPLRPGPALVIGRVDGDDPSHGPPHITIEIEQKGREWKGKHSWHHEWRETSRSVDARPFYVVRPNGERVRVELRVGVLAQPFHRRPHQPNCSRKRTSLT